MRSGLGSLVFEHGSLDFRDKGGACYDHIPTPVTMRPCTDWIRASRRLVEEEQRSYLNRDTWENVGGGPWDNRSTWDNWKK